jgi:hypothetical protein
MTDRTAFEKWARKNGYPLTQSSMSRSGLYHNSYYEDETCVAWLGWQGCAALSRPSTEIQPHSCALEPAELSQQAITQAPEVFDEQGMFCGECRNWDGKHDTDCSKANGKVST